MSKLFGRKIKVTLSTETKAFQYDNTFKITFQISRVADATIPDKATVKIYNPAPNSVIDSINNAYLQIEAGYEEISGVIYRGDIASAFMAREGSDLVLVINCGDGLEANKKEQQKAYGKGATDAKIILDMAKSLGLEFAKGLESKINSTFTGRKKGKTIVKGKSLLKLAELLKVYDFVPVISNNVLDIAKTLESVNDPAIVLTRDTGLIGDPTRKKIKRKTDKTKEVILDAVDFKALLIPNLFPKRQIKIDSELFTGYYVINSVSYSGDTRGQDWTAEGEAVSIEQ